jgi:hypothetical protein
MNESPLVLGSRDCDYPGFESEVRYKIGDTVIALRSEAAHSSPSKGITVSGEGFLLAEPGYDKFISREGPQVCLSHNWGSLPELGDWEQVFDSEGVWKLYRKIKTNGGTRHGIALYSPVFGLEPYQVTIFDEDYLRGDITTSASYFPGNAIPFPLRYPLAELIMINLLSQGRGVLLHACGIKVRDGSSMDGQGILFAGVSGAGKSTTARLWEGRPDISLLSDDRVILRKKDDGFWIYGTPWHGDADASSAEAAPLTHIFILEHSERNQARALTPVALAARLFVRSFPTFWERRGIEYTLKVLDDLSQTVPGHTLGFVPNSSVVDFILNFISLDG